MRSRYQPEMTSCPLECIFQMGIKSGHHVVRFLMALVWPHHDSPLLRVRGMRAATRMTLARALQLVSTSLGPQAAGTTAPAPVGDSSAPARGRCLQGCCLVPAGVKPGLRTRRNRINPSVARTESYWELEDGHCGDEPKVEGMRSGTARPESGSSAHQGERTSFIGLE